MTFRPSDDVLEDNENIKQSYPSSDFSNQYNDWNEWDWVHIFQNEENSYNQPTNTDEFNNSPINNIPIEEVKAPDLSELLKNDWKNSADDYEITIEEPDSQENNQETEEIWEKPIKEPENTQESIQSNAPLEIQSDKNTQTSEEVGLKPDNKIQEIENTTNSEENKNIEQTQESDNSNYNDPHNISDTERSSIVSWLEWGINSNLDFLVDNEWLNVVKRYKKVNRLFFRWGIFIFAFIIGIISWIFLNAKAGNIGNANIISDSSIGNKREEKKSDKILSPLIDSGVEIEIKVPYWSALIDWNSFLSKSNLISYKWIILPQTTLIDYNSKGFISMDDFDSQKVSREDIKNLIDFLIVKNSIYRKTANLPNVSDLRWKTNTLQWSLLDEFSLWCIDSDKVLDFVCDKFLWIFSKYGKYYDLSKYSSEVLDLVKDLINQGKNVDPICSMINEYVLHAGTTSEDLTEAMNYCNEDDTKFYRKVVDFIDIENSLWQPDLSDKVFNDPDLNAYKLLSAQQSVYKILDGVSSLNENYIKNYLDFVQALINKDKWNNKYLLPIYKDLLYVFNNDELYQKLMEKWKLSSDIKLKIDQINNWNSLYWYPSLLSQLTVSDIVKEDSRYTGMVVQEKTMDDIFAQYYAMNDRLTIRKVTKISDDKIRVQTEMFTDKIMSATNGETLKLTVVLYRQDNLLYVESIKVANQRKFTDILNIYASDWKVTLYAMMGYIEEQVWMWYEENPEDIEEQPTFCEQIQEREDISLYTCDDESISLYKWDVEYNFQLLNGVLDSFTISDEVLEKEIKSKLEWVMFLKDETPAIITSIIDFSIETQDDNIEKKLDIFNQFRIHFKLVPDDVRDIEWEPNLFLVDFTLWEFKLQANYNIETHLLTKINYADCSENVEIRNLTISITTENDSQLIEILNNPRIFLTQANPAAYKKYQKVCSKNGNAMTKQQ